MARFLITDSFQMLLIFTIVICAETVPRYVTDDPGVGTKNVTAHYCPFPCTMGNETACYPPPCPPPACVDPAKHKPTDCCVYCPNGLDCRAPDGSIVKYNHWEIVVGKNCTCLYPAGETTCK